MFELDAACRVKVIAMTTQLRKHSTLNYCSPINFE